MKIRTILLSAVMAFALIGVALESRADLSVGVDTNATWSGFMNVFETPQNGGAFVFASGWGTADLSANFTATTLTLGANPLGDPNEFWYQNTSGLETAPNFGAPGQAGNKSMEANMYVEYGSLPGQTITFSGNVLSDTLTLANNPLNYDANTNGWTSVAFIKDFAPDYSSFVETTVPLSPGAFSISLLTINDPARHIQYGFQTIGPNTWPTDTPSYGSVVIEAIPEPATIGLIGIFGAGLLFFRRRLKR